MTATLHLVFVIVQIAAFQYGATLVVRLASGLPKDDGNLVPEVSTRIAELHRRVCRVEMVLGGLLLAGALLIALVLPLSLGPKKLLLAAVSLSSTAGLVWGYLFTYRELTRIAGDLPDPGRRVAGLEPRKLSNYYPLWREVLPWGLSAITVTATIVLAARSDSPVRPSEAAAWLRPAVQLVLNLVLLLLTVIRVRSHTCLALGRKTWMRQEEFLSGAPWRAAPLRR